MASANYLDSASKALGPTLTGIDAKTTKEIDAWVNKVKSAEKEVTDLKVSGQRTLAARLLRCFASVANLLGRSSSHHQRALSKALSGSLAVGFRMRLTAISLFSSIFASSSLLSARLPPRKALNNTLASKTFLVGNTLSMADLALFSSLYDKVSTLPAAEQYAHLNLARYFSHISHLAAQLPHQAASHFTAFDPAFDGQPALERTDPAAERQKLKESKQAAAAAKDAATQAKEQGKPEVGAVAGAAAAAGAKKEKKAKAEGGEGKKKNEPAAAVVPLPSHVDLRVGKIVDIKRHPDADSLYLEQVDFGEPEGPRTVLSGLVNFVPIEKMQDRWVVGVCNLKPASMRGIKSHGMLLCATHKDGKEKGVEPVVPPEGSVPGERVYVEGYEGMEPETQLNPKKKIFETIQPDYCTTDSFECAWLGTGPSDVDKEKKPRRIRTSKGVCTAPGYADATLS